MTIADYNNTTILRSIDSIGWLMNAQKTAFFFTYLANQHNNLLQLHGGDNQ
jgi:hypothetical protein